MKTILALTDTDDDRNATQIALFPDVFPEPQFVSIAPNHPRRGIFWSMLFHTAIVTAWTFVPPIHSVIAPPVQVHYEPIDISEYVPLNVAELPSLAINVAPSQLPAAAPAKSAPGPRKSAAPAKAPATRTAPPEPIAKSKSVFAGPQQIVSNLPDATNGIQTILRPDLVDAPKVNYPLRLQSILVAPPPSTPQLAAPAKPEPAPTPIQEALSSAPPVIKPALPVPQAPKRVAEVEAPKHLVPLTPAQLPTSPQHSVMPDLAPGASPAPKAALVINALSVPPDTPVAIPNAELSGSFTVVPASSSTAAQNSQSKATGLSGEKSNKEEKGSGKLSSNAVAGGSGNASSNGNSAASIGKSARDSGGGGSNGRSGTANSGGSGAIPGGGTKDSPAHAGASSPGTGVGAANAAASLPGITIVGGEPRGPKTAAAPPSTAARPTYGITIISGGSSGGASRDMGVFGRDETVYTVFIPMSDAGGGPDWSLQYSLFGPPQGDGMLTPPVAAKRAAMKLPKGSTIPAGPVFVTAIINDTGILKRLRAKQPGHPAARSVIDSLRQCDFLPGQMNGKAVATKVLIGVAVTVADE